MLRESIANTKTLREYLNRWIRCNQNLYQVPIIIKENLFSELNKLDTFSQDSVRIGCNGAFLKFVKELLSEYSQEKNTKLKTKYETFYKTLNTLDGRWELEPTHIHIKYDSPLS